MKAQLFGFIEWGKEKILAGIKHYTTRIATDFRKKAMRGTEMILCTGIRTKDYNCFGRTPILGIYDWKQKDLFDFRRTISPVPHLTWKEFAIEEGFDDIYGLTKFFYQKKYIGQELRTYHFILGKLGLFFG